MIEDVDLLEEATRTAPETVALAQPDPDVRYTYREFRERVDRLAEGLSSLGVRAGDRVGILGAIEPSTYAGIHACWRVDAVPVPVDPTLDAERARSRLERVGVDVRIRSTATEPPLEAHPIADLAAPDSSGGIRPTSAGMDDVAVELFTSGTTGQPRRVPLTWRNLLSNATASAFRLGVLPTDRWLVCLQPFHMGGFAPIVRAALYGTGVVLSPPDPAAIQGAIERAEASGISIVPVLLERCLDEGVDLDTLRTVLVGGDRTPPELVARALDADVAIHTTYGMTETASQIATATPGMLDAHPGTVGRPLRGVEVTIESPDGRSLPRGETGRIVVAGPTVCPSVTEESEFATGDRGYLDATNRLFVTGREADRIVTGGETVDPRVVERRLDEHPAVDAAAVVGIPDEEWGERVGALLCTDGSVDPSAIVAGVADELRTAERPRTVRTTDALPRTPSGTVDRPAVRRLLAEGEGP